ncbi:hypothetical protein A0H81_12557 [Grifola frondosa]|uniref:protein-tyrosine-phosphatase n=1 Tax=Grifola frondosa TaxID=5627 RepID=A0A1C7LR27_GRIFR|nr:hypothetical protein A0H81_12557 [Grifola frondosa]
MYSQDLNANAALEVIKKSRPNVQPNDGFLEQLEVFHNASFKVSRRDKATRMFYLERVVQDVLNGDGSVETDMFAKFPRTPSDSTPATPNGPRRRIRCKMCRQELATREHMLDHGQLGPATPASASAFSPAASRRPSMHDSKSLSPLNTISPPTSRRPSSSRPLGPMSPLSPSSTFTTISRRPSQQEPSSRPRLGSNSDNRPLKSSLLALDGAGQLGQDLSDLLSLSESALEGGDSTDEEPQQIIETERLPPRAVAGQQSGIPPVVARRLSSSSGVLAHPSDIAAQLSSHPKLAALRLPSTGSGITPLSPGASATSPTRSGPQSPPILARKAPSFVPISPPILANPKCSGYFVEPMKWMEPFLEEGQMSGKILCPNKKCGVKLGNYDWAGVCCSCKEWVVPGFCIHRSKVDEVV